MGWQVEIVDPLDEQLDRSLEAINLSCPWGTFFQSRKWTRLLSILLKAEDKTLVLKDGRNVLGFLPALVHPGGELGPVLNSNPYFGSHGGPVLSPPALEGGEALIRSFKALAASLKCLSACMILAADDPSQQRWTDCFSPDLTDHRIRQTLELPESSPGSEPLFELFDPKRRNAIRKSKHSGIRVVKSPDPACLPEIHRLQKQNIGGKGGVVKSEEFFGMIPSHFEWGREILVYQGVLENRTVGYALLFRYKDTVEYFTPVIDDAFRALNPMDAIVYDAMVDTWKNGARRWNFGGTWTSQEGVYLFKKKWGARDYPYRYLIGLPRGRDLLAGLTPERLLEEYPGFYVVPFQELAKP